MLRERLTITLEPDLVAAADALVDKSAIRNRSHALEHLIKEGLGLHLLKQAFFFIGDDWTQDQVMALKLLCENQGIERIYLCATNGKQADVRTLLSAPEMTDVPLDFGDGGAMLLQKTALQHPFLLVWLNKDLVLPQNLIGAYTAHRQRNAVVTQLVTGDGTTYGASGLAIASPSLLPYIPAGIASLQTDVFPELLKTGKLAPYAY